MGDLDFRISTRSLAFACDLVVTDGRRSWKQAEQCFRTEKTSATTSNTLPSLIWTRDEYALLPFQANRGGCSSHRRSTDIADRTKLALLIVFISPRDPFLRSFDTSTYRGDAWPTSFRASEHNRQFPKGGSRAVPFADCLVFVSLPGIHHRWSRRVSIIRSSVKVAIVSS
jgi:hypothetical protein